MHKAVETFCTDLDKTAEKVKGAIPAANTLREAHGWQFPAMTKDDLAYMASQLASRIRALEIEEIDNDDAAEYNESSRRLQLLWSETVPNMNGNFQAILAYIFTLEEIERALLPLEFLVRVDNPKLLPARTATRLKSVNRTLDRIDQGYAGLTKRVEDINKAHAAAEALPTTLQELEEAKISLEEVKGKIAVLHQEIDDLHQKSTKTTGRIETVEGAAKDILGLMNDKAAEAARLIEQCEAAYQVTTTKGLAGAFDQRAKMLNYSIIAWVVGLLIALGFGAWLGTERIQVMSALLDKGSMELGAVLLHIVLSVLSIGGPLWFAWLATKQIGQRFRLAEDYAFKASVAKAYEGYRKQAASLDPEFAARLFGSALTRLEEPPLRFVEPDAHGSPWHEFIGSDAVQKALASVPRFQEQLVDLAEKAMETAGTAVGVAKSKLKGKDDKKDDDQVN